MKRKMQTWIALVILLTGFFTLFTALRPAVSAEQMVISLWHALPKENSPLFEELVNEYSEKCHGLFRIEYRRFETQEDLHRALLQNGEKPDIALIDTRWQAAIVKKNNVLAMEDLAKSKVGSSVMIVLKLDTFAQMWESSKLDGKLISLPFTGYNRALIVNKDILAANAIKDGPNVWGDIVSIGKKLNAAPGATDDQNWPYLIPVDDPAQKLADFYEVLLWQAGKDIIEPFEDGQLAAFDSPESKAVLTMLVDMVQKHKISPASNGDKANSAKFVGTPGDYLNLARQGKNVSVIRWPGKRGSINDLVVYSFIVFNKGGDSSKTDKIWHSIYNACEFKASSKWALTTQFLPQNKQVTLSPGYFEYTGQFPGVRTFLDQMKNSRVGVRDEVRSQVLQILGENIRLALKGQLTPEQALNEAEDKANILLDPAGTLRAKKAEMTSVNRYIDKVWDKNLQ